MERLAAEGQLARLPAPRLLAADGHAARQDPARGAVASGQGAVEDLGLNRAFWRGRRVLVTGHTGFKGGWLSLWLQALGAKVTGFALPPPTKPSLFDAGRVAEGMDSRFADLRDRAAGAGRGARGRAGDRLPPRGAAAGAAVLRRPGGNLRDQRDGHGPPARGGARVCRPCAPWSIVTSDKCYENREWVWGYRENEPMGGCDPYSSSKGCAELVTAAYRNSFFPAARHAEHGVAIATARAGNVIGGGDWAADRLVPDCLRAIDSRRAGCALRYPDAVRPWQHVLEPLAGYLVARGAPACRRRGLRRGLELRPRGRGCAAGALGGRANCVRAWGGGASWETRAGAAAARGELPEARLLEGARPAGLARALAAARRPSRRSCAWHKAFRAGADMRDVHARPDRRIRGGADDERAHATKGRAAAADRRAGRGIRRRWHSRRRRSFPARR